MKEYAFHENHFLEAPVIGPGTTDKEIPKYMRDNFRQAKTLEAKFSFIMEAKMNMDFRKMAGQEVTVDEEEQYAAMESIFSQRLQQASPRAQRNVFLKIGQMKAKYAFEAHEDKEWLAELFSKDDIHREKKAEYLAKQSAKSYVRFRNIVDFEKSLSPVVDPERAARYVKEGMDEYANDRHLTESQKAMMQAATETIPNEASVSGIEEWTKGNGVKVLNTVKTASMRALINDEKALVPSDPGYDQYIRLHTGYDVIHESPKAAGENLAKAVAASLMKKAGKDFSPNGIHAAANSVKVMPAYKEIVKDPGKMMSSLVDSETVENICVALVNKTYGSSEKAAENAKKAGKKTVAAKMQGMKAEKAEKKAAAQKASEAKKTAQNPHV